MSKLYKFTFQDGMVIYSMGLSKIEQKAEERKHGKLVKKELA